MLGASIENPAHGQGLEEGVLEKSKAEIRPQVYPLDFPEQLPSKPESACFIVLCFPLF